MRFLIHWPVNIESICHPESSKLCENLKILRRFKAIDLIEQFTKVKNVNFSSHVLNCMLHYSNTNQESYLERGYLPLEAKESGTASFSNFVQRLLISNRDLISLFLLFYLYKDNTCKETNAAFKSKY